MRTNIILSIALIDKVRILGFIESTNNGKVIAMRQATARDFIIPEFRDKKPEDYEIRHDGECVRKDRWEDAVQSIRVALDSHIDDNWEIKDVVNAVKRMIEDVESRDNETSCD